MVRQLIANHGVDGAALHEVQRDIITEEMISLAQRESLSIEDIKERGFLKSGDVFGFGWGDGRPNWVLAHNSLFGTKFDCIRSIFHINFDNKCYEAFIYECPPYIVEKGEFFQEEDCMRNDFSLHNVLGEKSYALFTNMNYFDSSARGWTGKCSATKFLGICRYDEEESIRCNHVIWKKVSDILTLK